MNDCLLELKEKCLTCRKCGIGGQPVDGCLSNVFSNMSKRARFMVVGQNPGYHETQQGRPFVGGSGEFFNKAIKDVLGLTRADFYITNTVKCYTTGNRPPTSTEIDNCQSILDEEMTLLCPVLIIVLGNPAMWLVTGQSGMTKHHGRIRHSLRYNKPVLPLWHPSPLNMNKKEKRDEFYQDLEKVAEFMDG